MKKMSVTQRSLECPSFIQVLPKKKKKTNSWVSECFGLPGNDTGQFVCEDIANCKLCKSPVSSKGGSTSNMLGYLKLHHPMKFYDVSNKAVGNGQSKVNADDPAHIKTKIYPTEEQEAKLPDKHPKQTDKHQMTMANFQPLDSHSSKRCTNAFTKFLETAMQPYNLVEQKSFIDMVNVLNSQNKLPGQKYFSTSAIPKLYSEVKEKVKHELSVVDEDAISMTTDGWTSIANTPFIAVTAHFITSEWTLQFACLSCAQFDKDHNAGNISAVLKDILSEWGINIQNIASCTTDNASNILKAVQELNLQNIHISCFGHNINIGVNHALELPPLKKAVIRLKKLQHTISMSWKM